jgi:methyltransferase-like protein
LKIQGVWEAYPIRPAERRHSDLHNLILAREYTELLTTTAHEPFRFQHFTENRRKQRGFPTEKETTRNVTFTLTCEKASSSPANTPNNGNKLSTVSRNVYVL